MADFTDATAASCDRRLQLYLPDELKELAHGKRIRFLKWVFSPFSYSLLTNLSVWRPLTTPVQDSPLALCDYRTVSPNDLVAADMVFPHYLDEAYEVLYNPNHRWFFKQGMEDGNVILLKLADSADEVAKRKFISDYLHGFRADNGSLSARGILGPFCARRYTGTGQR